MSIVTARRLLGAALLAACGAGAATAAIAPWYPRDGEDTCKVRAGGVPTVETPPPPWQVAITRPPGWVGQDPRVYTVPPILDCRAENAPKDPRWACMPSFLEWAKKNCVGLEVRQ